jgi:hypothetical protein
MTGVKSLNRANHPIVLACVTLMDAEISYACAGKAHKLMCRSVGLALGVHLGVSCSGVSVHLEYVSCKAYI